MRLDFKHKSAWAFLKDKHKWKRPDSTNARRYRHRVTDEEPEIFGDDELPRPPGVQRIAKSNRSSNSTARRPFAHLHKYITSVSVSDHNSQPSSHGQFPSVQEHLLAFNVPENGINGSETKIEVKGLTRTLDKGVTVLQNVNLEIPRGKIMGIIGPSGSGKSTLLRALNRLWEPSSGTVFMDGKDVTGVDVLELRRKVGMLFQLPVLFEGTVADNIRYGPQLKGKKLRDEEVYKLLTFADLDASFFNKAGSELSVGQAQRVALARTLANEPEVLLLDEPTSALDPISTQNIEDVLVKLKSRGLTIAMVSHSIKQIQRIADVVCLLVGGEIVEVLSSEQLSNAKHPMARRFLELSN
ncbi:ABC transporter I family member 17 [Tanacetum coccineum]